ncbi:hypothetical protein UPYG_G00223440 [Umbra pygmaea]|uniref:Uncharacterized protein n=1 Tax=Umbra pygmaea TaxID=75934 RepID=A0ABD0WGU0_UMBPY
MSLKRRIDTTNKSHPCSSNGLRLTMEGKFWRFCVTSAILLSGSSCNNISSTGCELVIVNNDTYSGVIQKGGACETQVNCSEWKGNCIYEGLCILSIGKNTHSSGCSPGIPNCKLEFMTKNDSSGFITLKNTSKDKQKITLYFPLGKNTSCYPSNSCPTGNLTKIICDELSQYSEEHCKGLGDEIADTFIISLNLTTCWTCLKPVQKPDITIILHNFSGMIDSALASEALNNLSLVSKQLGNASTAAISMGDVKGIVQILNENNTKDINYGISPKEGIYIVSSNSGLNTNFNRTIRVSNESYNMALRQNGTFVGILVFPSMSQDEKKSVVLNGEVIGINMGVDIANLTDTIDMKYENVDKKGFNVFCNSWNGEGKLPKWSTDGCQTVENESSITCQCSHLSFFAILLSPPPVNISASDVNALTYISYIGCGLSMFFLGVAIFMHILFSKTKSSAATKILMNLFVALFFLDLTFLTNETIANLGSLVPCVIMAAVMHYSMLSTFTWFLIEAVHLFLQLKKLNADIKHYMLKIYIMGWGFPAVLVAILLGLNTYKLISINQDDGNKVSTCWISDVYVLYGVNIGYYALVFVCTLTIFIIVVRQIHLLSKTKADIVGQQDSTYKNTLTILGLLFLLGITWGFAFFSFGPMIIPSYYIFCILNSFQGFFLFLYYYNSNKVIIDDGKSLFSNQSSSTSSNIYDNKPVENE